MVYHLPAAKGKFVLFNDASTAHWFSYYRLLEVKHMVIVTYLFRGNLLLPHRLLFSIRGKGCFIYTFPQTGQHICGPLVGTKNSPNCKCICHAGSIHHAGDSKPLQQTALLPELRPAPSQQPRPYSLQKVRINFLSFLLSQNRIILH